VGDLVVEVPRVFVVAVLAERVAVVGRHDHERLLQQAALAQFVEEHADLLVVVSDLGVVQVDQQFALVVGDRVGVIDRPLVQRLRLSAAQFAVSVQRRVLPGRLIGTMRVHIVVPQEERLVVRL